MNTIGKFITSTVVESFTKVNRSNGKRKRIENDATIGRVIDRCIRIKDIVVNTININSTTLTKENLFDTVFESISDTDKRYLEAIIGSRTYRECLKIIQYIINETNVSNYLTFLNEHTNVGQRKQLINSMIMIIIPECIKILEANTNTNYNKYTRGERNTSRKNTRNNNKTRRNSNTSH